MVPAGATPAGRHRQVSDGENEGINMDATEMVLVGMGFARDNNGGADVALYLDDRMLHECADGVSRFLPVIAVDEAGGYATFPDELAGTIAMHFGAMEPVAQMRVDAINALLGLSHDDALELVGRSMDAANLA
jgi:hypothetical protein